MKAIRSGKTAVLVLALVLALACKQSNADEAQKEQKNTEFKSVQFLYESCKVAVTNDDFLNSPCAIYIEGYIGGYRAGTLQMLARATKQREIIEEYDRNKCRDLDSQMYKDGGVQWLAGYFLNWMDRHQDVVEVLEKESGFMKKEAYGALNFITTNERFCTLEPIPIPE